MIPDTPEQLHHKEASELQSNVSDADAGVQQTHHKTLQRRVSAVNHTPTSDVCSLLYRRVVVCSVLMSS